MRILVVEDDREVGAYLIKGLTESGHVVAAGEAGREGLERGATEAFDALVIDRMLPGLDGLSIVAALRAAKNQTPILVLSALGDVDERVGACAPAATIICRKPFALSELLARLEAVVRRAGAETRLKVGDLELDLLTRRVTRAGIEIDLLPREFRLLEYLMRHAGQVVTRTMLLEKVWDHHFDPQTNVIDVHVSRLRQKIDKGFDGAAAPHHPRRRLHPAGRRLRGERTALKPLRADGEEFLPPLRAQRRPVQRQQAGAAPRRSRRRRRRSPPVRAVTAAQRLRHHHVDDAELNRSCAVSFERVGRVLRLVGTRHRMRRSPPAKSRNRPRAPASRRGCRRQARSRRPNRPRR